MRLIDVAICHVPEIVVHRVRDGSVSRPNVSPKYTGSPISQCVVVVVGVHVVLVMGNSSLALWGLSRVTYRCVVLGPRFD